MGVYSSAKSAIVAILGLAGTIEGWRSTCTTHVIYNGLSIGSPIAMILFSYWVWCGYSNVRPSLKSIGAVVGIACLTAGINIGILKILYPRAPMTNQMPNWDFQDFQQSDN
jgi:hypothetical protein